MVAGNNNKAKLSVLLLRTQSFKVRIIPALLLKQVACDDKRPYPGFYQLIQYIGERLIAFRMVFAGR
jgi:hypothetical protein